MSPQAQPIAGSTLRERELLPMLSAIMALMALAIDMLLPAFDDMRAAYGLSDDDTSISQVITAFFIGLAVAQIFWGPLADRFGRKRVLYAGMVVYALGAIGSALAPSLPLLLASRFVWGLGAAGARVVAVAIIRDVFVGSRMARAMSQIMAVFVLVPVFAPALGAGLIAIFPWRSVFWFSVIAAGLVTLWSLRLPETLAPESVRPLEFHSTMGGYGIVARHRLTLGYTLASLFLQGTFTAYLGSSERIIGEIYGRDAQFPFIFGAVAVLFGLGALINGRIVEAVGIDRLVKIMLVAVLSMGGLLLGIALATGGRPNFWVFLPLLGILLAMFMFLMPNLNTGAMEPMGELAGTASSFIGASRVAGGAVLGAFVDASVGDTVTPFVVGTILFTVAALASVAYATGTTLPARVAAVS